MARVGRTKNAICNFPSRKPVSISSVEKSCNFTRTPGETALNARTVGGKTSRETAYLTASVPAADAQLAELQDWAHRGLS